MLDFQQKRKVRAFLYHRVTIGILAAIVLLALHSTWSVYQKKIDSEEMKNVSLQNVETLRSRENELNSKIERLDTNSGIEAEIRSKFSVAKDKENMVVVVDDVLPATTTAVSRVGFWESVRNFFSNL